MSVFRNRTVCPFSVTATCSYPFQTTTYTYHTSILLCPAQSRAVRKKSDTDLPLASNVHPPIFLFFFFTRRHGTRDIDDSWRPTTPNGGPWNYAPITDPDTSSLVVPNLESATEHEFRVQAVLADTITRSTECFSEGNNIGNCRQGTWYHHCNCALRHGSR